MAEVTLEVIKNGASSGGTESSSNHGKIKDGKKDSPNLPGRPPSPRSRSGEASPRIFARSPVPSPALMGYGSQLDPIPEDDHAHPSPERNAVQHGAAFLPIQEPPVLVLGPTFSSGSISSLESRSSSAIAGPSPPIVLGNTVADTARDTDVETIGTGGESDTTEGPRDVEPLTPARILDARAKGKRRLSISSGFDKVRHLIGRGKTSLSEKSAMAETDGSGVFWSPSQSSSRRSSTGSAQLPGTAGAEWPPSPDLSEEGSGYSALSGVVMRRDENVLKLTRSNSIIAASPVSTPSTSIISQPVSRNHSRSPTPPNILTSTARVGIDLESASTSTPDLFPKSSSLALTPGNVPGPSPLQSSLAVGRSASDLFSNRTPTSSGCLTPTPYIWNSSPVSAGVMEPPARISSIDLAFQPRRSSMTSPVMNKTKSLDQEAQNLLLNALQRGSGGQQSHGHSHGLSLSRSSTKDSTMTDSRKPGVSGALAALGFKTGAAVGATEAVKKSSINVLLPSEPIGAQKTASAAPGVSLTAPTPHLEQEDPATKSGSGYFGGRRQKGSRSSRSANKEEKYRRSLSPFFKGRRSLSRGNASEKRDPSPPVGALSDAGESDGESVVSNSSNRYRPQATAFSRSRRRDRTDSEDEDDQDQASDDGDFETDTEYDEDALSHEVVGPDGWVEDVFDPQTEENTKANAVYYEGDAAGLGGEGVLEDEEGHEIEVEVDALGEGRCASDD